MNKHTKCGENCCHDMHCCPRGLFEHIENYKYMRNVTDITFIEYWWFEVKSLLGFNRVTKEDEL